VITDALTRRGNPAFTSDRWHVVHAKWSGTRNGGPPFARTVVSEHADREHAVVAAKRLAVKLDPTRQARPVTERDQIYVRPPQFRSLKFATHKARRRRD
jgi:hypothetical protein